MIIIFKRYYLDGHNFEEDGLDDGHWQETIKHFDGRIAKVIEQIQSKFDWKKAINSVSTTLLLAEYVKFVEMDDQALGRPELLLIALQSRKKIHVYQRSKSDGSLVLIETLNPLGDDEHYILQVDPTTWRRLDPDTRRKIMLEHRSQRAMFYRQEMDNETEDYTPLVFQELLQMFVKNGNDQLIFWIKLLDPEFTKVERLVILLKQKLLKDGVVINFEDLRHFVKQVVESAVEEDNATITLIEQVVSNSCQHRWTYELCLLEIEDYLGQVLLDQAKWRHFIYQIQPALLTLFRQSVLKSCELSVERLEAVLKLLTSGLPLTVEDADRLSQLSLSDWLYELKGKYWETKINQLKIKISEEQLKEAVYYLLELENKKGSDNCHEIFEKCHRETKLDSVLKLLRSIDDSLNLNQSSKKERSAKEIVNIIRQDNNTSEEVKKDLEKIEKQVEFSRQPFSFLMRLTRQNNADRWKNKQLKLPDQAAEYFYIFDQVVQEKYKFKLRDNQRTSILAFLTRSSNTLAQISTGEGKSIIVAAVAIGLALSGRKVDVVTSNAVLAIRDSVRKGSICIAQLYKTFNVTVSNNCSHDEEERKKAYCSQVVYGELSFFQKDYLLDSFYGRDLRGDRTFDCLIVDEVDCMLLDRGNNTLYLSHSIPGMEALESLYVFIWAKVRLSGQSLDKIKSAVLFDLYGRIDKNDLKEIDSNISLSMINSLWTFLLEARLINGRGDLLMDSEQINEDSANFTLNPAYNSRLVFYLQVFKNINIL